MKAISASIVICAGVWIFPQGNGSISNYNFELGALLVAVGLAGWVISLFRAD
jgi:hypothetical protein